MSWDICDQQECSVFCFNFKSAHVSFIICILCIMPELLQATLLNVLITE